MDFLRDGKIPLHNVGESEEGINSTAQNRAKKRLRIRVPVFRADGNRKVTVVRRRPLKPLSSAQQALPAPRRFIVTRVRAPVPQKATKYKGRSKNLEIESELKLNEQPAPRHKVTVTRRRKIQPTKSDETFDIAKSRITRKKLVNVRPISFETPTPTPTPTPTSTEAIITTGFYEAATSSDEESDDEDYDEDYEDPDPKEYSEQEEVTNDLATPSLGLAESSDIIEKKTNEITGEGSEITTPISESPTEAPVILTDHFFLPFGEEEEDYEEEEEEEEKDFNLSTEQNLPEIEEATTKATEEAKAFPETESTPIQSSPNVLEPSPSISVLETLQETNLLREKTSGVKILSPDYTIASNSVKQSEFDMEAKNSLRSESEEPNEIPNLNDVVLQSSEDLESTYTIPSSLDATQTLRPVSSSILEDASAKSIDHPFTDLSTLPFPDPRSTSEEPTPPLASEITANVYYSETVVTSTRLRTYTYVVTKLNGLQTEVTSSTAVRPKVTTLTLTIPITATPQHAAVATSSTEYFPATPWVSPSPTATPASAPKPNDPQSPVFSPETIDDDESAKEEPEDEQGRRFNLATRIMSNGVEVIVAGSTPAPALRWETASPPATLTLSDAVVMLMPREKPQEFVTKTRATTFTYLTTFTDRDGSARVSTRHQVVYNTATEERRLPADSTASTVGLTLQASPTLGTEVFETTYAYLDLPVDSRGTTVIKNTVTAPQHYLDMVLEPSEAPFPETNTYLSTRTLERTVTENGKATVHAVNDIVTRLVVTESARSPRPTISLDGMLTSTSSPEKTPPKSETEKESEILKTYYVTYTYSSTLLDHGSTVVRTTVATSAEVVTEKVPGYRKTAIKTSSAAESKASTESTTTLASPAVPEITAVTETPTISANVEPIQIFATRTYLTTYTYFTTLLLPGEEGETSTSVSSRSRIVMNVVTESTAPSLLDTGYMNVLLTTSRPQEKPVDETSDVSPVNNVVTGSTIIFFDEEDRIDPTSTSNAVTLPSTETVPVSTVTEDLETRSTTPSTNGEDANNTEGTSDAPPSGSGSFGSLSPFGSFGINGLSALGPVITAMAGLLQGKTNASRRNGTSGNDAQDRQDATTPRSPIYIPVAEFANGDIETAESQNIGNRLANLNRNYIPETRHKSSASLANGIPISPGEVITANSDVIIGKPGKIGGPRPPQSSNLDNEPGGIRPPPLPPQSLLQSGHSYGHRETSEYHKTQLQIFPARQVFEDHLQVPVEYGASAESHQAQPSSKHPQRVILRTDSDRDVMVNDPLLRPPATPGASNDRVKLSPYPDRNPMPDLNEPDWSPEKYRRPWSAKDPLKPVESVESSVSGGAQWIRNDAEEAASSYSKVQGPSRKPNPWSSDNDHQLPKENHKRPPWAQRDPLLPGKTVLESSLQPKVSEQPAIIRHVVPHVIDRDTGQPLLVNIQPSQVANVVIPQGGNQALIFGDTNEPHITGQYFDDPSPYPEPEVAPGFVGVQKVEHAPQYFGQSDPSEYMVPPPSPQLNFKPLPQSPIGRPPSLPERPSHVRPGTTLIRDYGQVQRRPTDQPMTSPPRRTEVDMPPHRYILLGRPGDLRPTNVLSGDGLNWKLKGDRKPVTSQPTTQSGNWQRPSGHFGSVITKPTINSQGSEVYMGRPGVFPVRKQQYPPPSSPSSQSSYRPMIKKPDTNLVPPDRSPAMNPFVRETSQSHGSSGSQNNVIVTITESVPIGSENMDVVKVLHPPPFQVNLLHESVIPHHHPADKMGSTKLVVHATESSIPQQSTGENVPTGAIEYHDPSTDPKAKPEDTSYYPRVPTVKPEVQSLGQIIPQDEGNRIPEIWMVNTQTERSSLTNDSDISESIGVRIQVPAGPMRGDMTPEPDTDADFESEANEPGKFVTPGTKDSFDSVGSVTTVVGKPLGVEQGVSYGNQQQQNQDKNHGDFAPNKGVPFAHRDREPAIVQGVPFRQNQYSVNGPYEGPIIVQGKPFGVYVDGHVNVGRPYGNDQRETRRPVIAHDVIQGVPFGYHGNQKPKPQPAVHDLVPPLHKGNNGDASISNSNSLDRRNYTDLKPPSADPFEHHHYQQQPPRPFAPSRQSEKENERPEPIFTRPEIATMPPQPSPALSPPAEPGTNEDLVASAGNQSRPGSTGTGNYYEGDSGGELNLAESTYLLPHSTGSGGRPRPEEKFDSFEQGHPNHSHETVRPKPASTDPENRVQQPLQPATKDRVELEFSMPVENVGEDNEESETQTERPPSMFLGTSTTTKKTPTKLATLPTNLAAPPPEISINRDDSIINRENNSYPVTQEPHTIPQSRPRPRVPYRDMMPPPLRPTYVFHGSKGNGNSDASQSEGLQPPPLSTEVVGMSPPPPKYIPLEESTTTATRPFLVELLSQDMVPPAPIAKTSSRPVQEIPTIRPAVAVSGSIRIASATATPHVPVVQNVEADIPIVHGTVDLPVIIEMHGPLPPPPPSTIAPEAKKSERVSIYTARPFETKPVSRVSIQPTSTQTTSSLPSNSVQRPLRIDNVEPSRSSTFIVTVRPTRLPETVANDSTAVKRPGRPGRPVFLQPSKDADTLSLEVEPTQFLTSVKPVETAATTNSPTKTRVVWPSKISTRIRDSEIKTTVSRPTEDLPKLSNTTTETPQNETEHETVLYVVTKLGSASSSTTRTVLLTRTRTLTSTTVETVTETLLHSASPTTIVSSSTILRPIIHEPVVPVQKPPPSENESIFVVMSDQNPPEPGAEEVEAEYGEEDAEATRDEQDPVGNEIHRVLAGGILGAPVFPQEPTAGRCLPECRASKAEVCAKVDNDSKCVCRPGFARMFLDRPCKPIYTYTLRLGLDRLGRDPVSAYAAGLNDTTSNEYQKLAGPTKEALDRTMMQSDLRDVYRGLDVARFNADPAASVEFHVQLSENANETRLKEVVRKYLVGNNFSLGGTEVYASKDLGTVDVQDFDECATEEGGPHHDCSPHAACFNLRGSYQCSCREGWADLSDNLPSYPGRICSQAPLGCAACNNKGHCVINTNGQEVCECFPWHGGQRCQVNLKVLLITLVTTGIVLLALLGVCVGLACLGRPGRRLISRSGDRRAMIPGGGNGGDTSSEGSAADLATIPHHVPHVLPAPPQTAAPAPPSKRPSGAKSSVANFAPAVMGIPAHPRHVRAGVLLARPRDSVRSNAVVAPAEEQRDRSLTVMIPRAKYRSIPQSPQAPTSCKPLGTSFAVDERKLINYLEGGPRPETRKSSLAGKRDSVCKDIVTHEPQGQGVRNPSATSHPLGGALVSAGFQVSATVTRPADAESTLARSCGETTVETSTKILRTNDVLRGDQGSTLARSCGETTIQPPTKLLRVDLGEAGSTLARSCGETTIQPPTKLATDRRGSREPRDNASDGHTMAERDVGGTLRMPAQRPPFFDPDRASDRESNFDSL